MAIYDREFKEVPWKTMLDCVRWCQNRLQLRDWEIDLIDGCHDENDPDLGSMHYTERMVWKNRATVYVSIKHCRERNMNPLATLCHEMLHVLVSGKCHVDSPQDLDEYIAWILEDMVYLEFCRYAKLKPSPINEELR